MIKSLAKRALRTLNVQLVRPSNVDRLLSEKRELEETVANLRAALSSHPVGSYVPALRTSLFEQLCIEYDRGSSDQRDALARKLMARTIADPDFAAIVSNENFADAFKDHELRRYVVAASHFPGGGFAESVRFFESIPTALAVLCAARTQLAADNDDAAMTLLQKGRTQFADDLFIAMELATLLYQQRRIGAANEIAAGFLHEFKAEHDAIEPLQREIETAIREDKLAKDAADDIYGDGFVIDNWLFYWRSYTAFNEFQDGNVALDTGIRREVEKLLSGELAEATTFIDFGAFCGFTIAELAKKYPKVKFIGIDRPQVAKDLNDRTFAAPNVEFIAGDVMDLLASGREFGARPVLFHSRTAVFCYPAYLQRLYAYALQRGINDIVFQEGSTFSRWHLKFFEQGRYPAISMAGRGSTFLHDYPMILGNAGFDIKSSVPIRLKLLLDDRSGFGADHRVTYATVRTRLS